jgi:hypothetical protein
MIKSLLANPRLAKRLLQYGLAFVFLYAAVAGFLRPNDWVGYLPSFLSNFLSPYLILKVFGVIEIVLTIWLLSSWKLFYAAIFSALVLAGITLTNLSIFDVTFRDVGLFLSALALVNLSSEDTLS